MKGSFNLRHLFGLASATVLTLALLLASRFWIWTAPWGDGGLLGLRLLSPYGDLVRGWVGATPLAEFDFLVWGAGGIALLSLLHWLAARIWR